MTAVLIGILFAICYNLYSNLSSLKYKIETLEATVEYLKDYVELKQ